MKSDLELAVNAAKTLENLLEERWGVQGRGLHELTDGAENRLDREVVRDLRYIATLRNKIVHESDYTALDDRARFEAAFERAKSALGGGGVIVSRGSKGGSGEQRAQRIPRQKQPLEQPKWVVLLKLLLAVAVIVFQKLPALLRRLKK